MNAGNKNTPSMHDPWRRNVTTLMVILKTVTYAKISPKMVNPREVAGNAEEEEVWSLCKAGLGANKGTLTFSTPSLRLHCSLPGPVLQESLTVLPRRWCHLFVRKLQLNLINDFNLRARQWRAFILHCPQTVCLNIQIKWKKQVLYLDSVREYLYLVNMRHQHGKRCCVSGVEWVKVKAENSLQCLTLICRCCINT